MTQDLSKDEVKSIARDAGQCNGCQWDDAAESKCVLTGDCRRAATAVPTAVEAALPIKNALATQVGGGHYKDMVIQPVEFIHKNGLGFLEGCVVKRLCRWRKKDGVQDLRKAIHEIELLIELETTSQPAEP